MPAERLDAPEARRRLRIAARRKDVVLGDRRHEQHKVDAAFDGRHEMARDLRHRDGLVLDIDRAPRSIDRALVLLQDRSLDARRGVAAGIEHALDLHRARPARRGGAVAARIGARQLVGGIAGPVAVGRVALARLVPALDEIVPHVRGRRPGHLDIDVVPRHGDAGEVEAAHEGRLRWLAAIDHPALLVLAEHARRPVPADFQARAATRQQVTLVGCTTEHATARCGLGVGPPYEEAHVEAAGDGAVQHVEQRAASVGQEEVIRIEGNRQPDAVARAFDRLADPPHGLLAIDQRANAVAGPRGIGTRRRGRNVREGSVDA